MKTKLLDLMLKTGALKFGDFTLSSGQKSNYYIDIKQMTLHSGGMDAVATAVAKEVEFYDAKVQKIDAVGGPELGAVAIVGATLFWLKLFGDYENMLGFIVRKQAKEHGTKRLVEGPLPPGEPLNVAVIEDVTTTGDSAIRAIQVLRAEGYNPVLAITVVDRQQGAAEKFQEMGVDFVPILKASDILDSEQAHEFRRSAEV